jgi:hypothetical protein
VVVGSKRIVDPRSSCQVEGRDGLGWGVYNTNEFRTEIMYDYYIAMKSMFLVVKLSSHPSIGYASLTILLP